MKQIETVDECITFVELQEGEKMVGPLSHCKAWRKGAETDGGSRKE